MKESILTRVTSTPLARPTSAPISSTAITAAHQGRPWPCSPIASTWEMPRLKPAERSKWLAVIGMNTASATRACTDLLLRIDLMLKQRRESVGLAAPRKRPAIRDQQNQQAPNRDRARDRRADVASGTYVAHGSAPFADDRGAARRVGGQACDVEFSSGISRYDMAPTEHEGAMADALDFLEIGGEQQHRESGLQGLLQQVIDLRFGADVDADGRLLQHQKTHFGLHPARKHHLLLVAAAERGDQALGIARLDRKASEDRAGLGELIPQREIELKHPLSGRGRVDVDVLAHRHVGGEAFLAPPAGNEADLFVHRVGGVGGVDPLAVELNMAAEQCDLAEDRPADRMMPGAAQADQGRASRRRRLRTTPGRHSRRRGRRPANTIRGARRGRGLTSAPLIERPTIFSHEIRRRGLADRHGRDPPPVAQHRHPVGDAENLVEPMGDIDDADAARRRRRSASSRRLTSASGSAAVGSSRTRMSECTASARRSPRASARRRGASRPATSGSMSLPMRANASSRRASRRRARS